MTQIPSRTTRLRRVAIGLWIGAAAVFVALTVVGMVGPEVSLWLTVGIPIAMGGVGGTVWRRSDPIYDYQSTADDR